MIQIERFQQADEQSLGDILRLVAELRSNTVEHRGELSDLQDIIANENAIMVVAKDGESIVGMASLYVIPKVGKRVGTIEDVIVGSHYRGQGIGRHLMEALIDSAREQRLEEIYLTSKPSRDAANNLYTKLGFELVGTNPYKLRLK